MYQALMGWHVVSSFQLHSSLHLNHRGFFPVKRGSPVSNFIPMVQFVTDRHLEIGSRDPVRWFVEVIRRE
jgi:hypothetical protein